MKLESKLFAGLVAICTTVILGMQGLSYVKTKKLITSLKNEDSHTSPISYWGGVVPTGKANESTNQSPKKK